MTEAAVRRDAEVSRVSADGSDEPQRQDHERCLEAEHKLASPSLDCDRGFVPLRLRQDHRRDQYMR